MKSPAIAIAAPLSGSSARIGAEMQQAAALAVEETNARGGILGTPVHLRIADDAGDVERGLVAARERCTQPDVLGVIGHLNSDVSIAASRTYARAGIAMITPIASNPALTEPEFGNVFRFTNRDDVTARAMATYLRDPLGKRSAVVIENDTAYGRSMAACFANAFLNLGGDILLRETIATGARDFRKAIERWPADFDVLFYGGMFEGAALLRAMREAGLEQLFASGDGCWDTTAFLAPAGAAAIAGEGVLVLSASPEIGRVEGARNFAENYAQRHGPITNYAVNAYDATRLLLGAFEAAAKTTAHTLPRPAEIIDAVRALRFSGIAYDNPVEWDTNGENRSAVTALNVVENGRFREVAEYDRENRLVYAT